MQEQPIDLWLAGVIATLAMASVAIWLAIAARGWRGPVLPYEPRRPVPWNFAAPLLILLLVLIRLVSLAMGQELPRPDEFAGPLQMSEEILSAATMQIALFGSMLVVVALFSKATLRDLGLPEFTDEFGRDLRIGAVAWLAAVLPVYGLQGLLAQAAGEQSSHPMIQMIQREPNGLVMFVAFIAAVLVAPVCEEAAFRLLLQGWLEKWEDRRRGGYGATVAAAADDVLSPSDSTAAFAASSSDSEHVAAMPPPRRGLAGLPHGYLPIVLSALVFAAAHSGHGPDPVALFLLALILGYLYQRTHRIIPSIVTHMLFNFTTLAILWLSAAEAPV